MSAAFLPSPSRAAWQLGPLPVRAYALCLVAGIVLAVWLADRRYRASGGRAGVIMGVATWAVACGLAGARACSVIVDYQLYLGSGHDWLAIFKIWDGGLAIAGGLAAGLAGAWFACRRGGVSLAPVAGAAAPGLAFGLAAGYWGNWFSQQLYGSPSTLPWAVEISPSQRAAGYENYATFQPVFAYQSLWDLLTGLAVLWAARRFLLTGDRALALCLAVDAAGRCATDGLRIDLSHRLLGLWADQWLMLGVAVGGICYLYLTRHKRGPDRIAEAGGTPGEVPRAAPAGRTRARPNRLLHRL